MGKDKSKLIYQEVHNVLQFSPEVDLETNTGVQVIYFGMISRIREVRYEGKVVNKVFLFPKQVHSGQLMLNHIGKIGEPV